MKHSWIEARRQLIDASGKLRPVHDDEPLKDQCDHAPHGGEGAHISLSAWTSKKGVRKAVEEPQAVLECTAVADELGAEQLVEELAPPKVRRERQMKILVDPNLTVLQKAAKIRKNLDIKAKRAKMKLAIKDAVEKDLRMLRRIKSTYSRSQLFQLIIPTCGKRKRHRLHA